MDRVEERSVDQREPENLGQDGRVFWRTALLEREFTEIHDLTRLAIAAKCLDEIRADEETLRIEGRFTSDRFNRAIPHPAVRTLSENRTCFLRVIRELGLDQVNGDTGQLKIF